MNKVKRNLTIAVLCLATLAFLFSAANTNTVSALVAHCNQQSCNDDATCTGDFFSSSGCSVQCYRNVQGQPGQIQASSGGSCSQKSNPNPVTGPEN